MSVDLILKPSCNRCGSVEELYGSNCKHLTLCVSCGRTMAQNRGTCYECGTPVTRLIREYNVRACSSGEKNYFIGRFATGLPNFSKKSDNKWSLQKEGLQGRQITDTLREKYKNKPWLLEDETGSQFHGPLEGSQSATYYLLMKQGGEFVAMPAGSWYNFNKVAQYKQLTLEEAEEKMKNRRKTADGYERWMMKAANNGAAAFGEVERPDDKEAGVGGGKGRKKGGGEEEEGNVSDRGDEDEEEEAARKSRLGLNKRGGGDDDEEGLRGGDLDGDDDDIEKGDDWEHEEIFTDDDEAVGNDPDERDDLITPDIPAPPEIKQDDDDDEENDDEGGGLSKSGKELKKLLGRSNGMNDSDGDDDDDDDDDDLEDDISPVLTPKKEAVKEEPIDTSPPSKPAAPGSNRASPSTNKKSKGKRKVQDDEPKSASGAPTKKVKTENDVKLVKDEPTSSSRPSVPPKGTSTPPSRSTPTPASVPATGPVSEDEIRAVFKQNRTPITTQDLVAKFKARLQSKEDKNAFAGILRKISKIQKINGNNYVVLRDKK